MIRVVVADDQALVRGGIRMMLEAQPDIEVVADAEDGNQAVALVRELLPDVVLMDIRMPGTDGIEGARRIVERTPSTKVLMLTTFDQDEYVYAALKAGASGFLLKSVPPEQLVLAVRTTAAGDALLAPVITRRLIEQFVRRPAPGYSADSVLDQLTDRERDVLRLIARGRSNAEIAHDLFLGEGTVKTHVNRLFRKLAIRDRAQAVVVAYETGLVHPGEAG